MCQAQLHWEAGAYARCQEALQRSAEFCSDTPAWRLNLAHALVAQEGGPARLAEAAELYESLLAHFAGGGGGGAGGGPGGWAAGGAGGGGEQDADAGGSGDAAGGLPPVPGGSLLDVPPAALANLCVCYVVGAQNEAAEELLRRLEEEVGAAEEAAAAAAGAGVAAPPPPHLSLTNLAIGTLYCSKGGWVGGWGGGWGGGDGWWTWPDISSDHRAWHAMRDTPQCCALTHRPCQSPPHSAPPRPTPRPGNFEFGISRVMRALEPLPGALDAARWRAAAAALLALLDAAAKHMVALKDALVAELLAWLEDVESAGRGLVVGPPPAPGLAPQTAWSQARALRALLMKMHD